ncbi:MAG: hypothetical protein QMD14_00200 [Candidatus Aenigmarchaeota archaeon]|nr:hypothetical protein [Candidatus Aenigmarchaeota archaeon]
MEEIIAKKYNELTKGKSDVEARISIFEYIRNIPYYILPELLDSEKGPIKMLKMNKGSCQPKHFLLEQMYTELGISVLYVRYAFKWDEIGIDYPPKLKELAKQMPITHHLACEADIEGKSVLVDATLDPPLKKIYPRVNEKWDGISDTLLAISKFSDKEFHHPLTERVYLGSPVFSKLESEFYTELNSWLEEVRKNC